MTNIVEFEDVSLDSPILIEGFSGSGKVGVIAAQYLIEKLDMKQIGFIDSDKFPPFVIIHNGKPFHSARIYASEKMDIILIISEYALPMQVSYEVSDAIYDWASKRNFKSMVSLSGIKTRRKVTDNKKNGAEPKVFGFGSTDAEVEKLKSLDVEIINDGISSGLSALLLVRCHSDKKPALSILGETPADLPDYHSAAAVITKLSKLLKFDLDIKPLLKEAKLVDNQLQIVYDKLKNEKEKFTKNNSGNSMYV
ncbi:MAG: proteasome assembly chaperone family protein [Candidatus Diapherotrites archaeon]|nr:proteasome assembly chaperone family protein [Candidatus Diapherotrites archaeon]